MNQSPLKKWPCGIIFVLLLIALCVFNIPIPIDRAVDALEVDLDDDSHVVQRTVTLKGYYHINLFSSDSFSGIMTVSDYGFTDGSLTMQDLLVGDNTPIRYQTESSPGELIYFGSLWSSRFLNDIMIWSYTDNEGNVLEDRTTADGIVIVSGVNSYEEAVQAFQDAFYD